MNLDIGPYTLLIPIMLTGFALSFVFVPLANLATSTIPREEMGNATGLFNMLRNIGGSIGIAMATTALIRRAALHQTDLAGQLSPANPVLQQKSAQIGGYLAHRIGPNAARPGSFGLLYGLMEQQAALKAYVDVFRWTALLAFFCAAAVGCSRNPSSTPLPRRACIDRGTSQSRCKSHAFICRQGRPPSFSASARSKGARCHSAARRRRVGRGVRARRQRECK